jgi:hypothetical protein
MSETTKAGEGFIAYEYKEVLASGDLKSVYADGYPNFGWQPENEGFGRLRFKRNRKIRNKAELTRLQRQFESNVKQIESLENSKTTKAQVIALTIGILGTAFMAGSTFAFIYAQMIPLMIILAIPGFIGWILPYFSYKRVYEKRIEMVTPLIDQQYDAIAEACEKANSLLN